MFRALALLPAAFALCAGCDSSEGGAVTVPQKYGLLRLATTAQTVAGTTMRQSQASALFVDAADPGTACQRRVSGACTLYRCAAGPLPSAGTITLKAGAETVTLTARPDGGYQPFSRTDGAVFQAGQTVAVSAFGAAVPAWKTDLALPADAFTLAQPELGVTLSAVADRKMDLGIRFGTAARKVRLSIVQDPLSTQAITIDCLFDGGSGGGTVPAAFLADLLPSTGGDHVAALLVGPVQTQTAAPAAQPGGWRIDVSALGNAAAARLFVR